MAFVAGGVRKAEKVPDKFLGLSGIDRETIYETSGNKAIRVSVKSCVVRNEITDSAKLFLG
jgi:hypothetical protein